MSKFKAGDRIKRIKSNQYNVAIPKEAVVKFVGDDYYLVDAVVGKHALREKPLSITFVDSHYERVPTFPERWFNLYDDKHMDMLYGYRSRAGADRSAVDEHRIGVLHISPDGSVEMLEP